MQGTGLRPPSDACTSLFKHGFSVLCGFSVPLLNIIRSEPELLVLRPFSGGLGLYVPVGFERQLGQVPGKDQRRYIIILITINRALSDMDP
jgi:hypothetical protein